MFNVINNKKIAGSFSFIFILIGVFGIVFLDKFVTLLFEHNSSLDQGPLTFGILFMLLTGIILYFMINHMQKVIARIDKAYSELKKKDKDRLVPYQSALDKSVDGIHWFTLDGKFIYVNQATCDMDGYTKEEFEDMYLSDIDPNFKVEDIKNVMLEIRNTPNWRLETTHRRKDGSIYPVEVSGHGFIYEEKEFICAFARDMTQRMEYRTKFVNMNKELQKSVDEKEILLKEIHHRVKNNMEIISSLLNMQAHKSDDMKFKEAMIESQSKIHAMALVHEFLYLGENLAYINVCDYIKKLINDIKELYITQNTSLKVDLNIDEISFSINRCIQVGMLIHELCVNALKYAFKEDRDNLLCIHIKIVEDEIYIKIRDNGDGLKNLDDLEKEDSMGMQLVHSIVDFQLHGSIDFKNNNGLECNIIFPQKEIE